MKKIKEEKGAISILVILTMLFFVSFLVVTYIFVANKADIQLQATKQVKDMYEEDANEIYNSYFANSETESNVTIPIYTVEQLLKIGSNEYIQINEVGGKYYYFSPSATYVLMNNLDFETNEWTIDEIKDINLAWNDNTIIINGEKFPIDYTYILESLRERGALDETDTLNEETLIEIYQAQKATGLSIDCFTVFKETIDEQTTEYVAYLYGGVYKETFVYDENGEGDGVASYDARVEAINLLNTLVDGMLLGDINEDEKLDETDIKNIEMITCYDYSFSPYKENDEWWIYCYYTILADINQDGSADSSDTDWYTLNDSIADFIVKYDIENGYGNWVEIELQSFNY